MRAGEQEGTRRSIFKRYRAANSASDRNPPNKVSPPKARATPGKPPAPAPASKATPPSTKVTLTGAGNTTQAATYTDPRKTKASWGQSLNQNVHDWGKQAIENLDNAAVAALQSGDNTTAMVAASVRAPARSFISGVTGLAGTVSLLDGNVRQQAWQGIKTVAANPGQVVDATQHYLDSHSLDEIAADAYAEIGGAMMGAGIARAASLPAKAVAQEVRYAHATLERQVNYGHIPTRHGRVFQDVVANDLATKQPAGSKVVQELHMSGYTDATQSRLAPGHTKMDVTTLDSQNRVTSLNEVKLRSTSPATRQQKVHQPKLTEYGGIITGPARTLDELRISKGHPVPATAVNRVTGPAVPHAVRPGVTAMPARVATAIGATSQAAGSATSREVVSSSNSKNYVTSDGRMVGNHTSYTRAEAQSRQAAREREEAARREASRINHERAFSRSEAKDTAGKAADRAAAERSAANHERAFSRSEARDLASHGRDAGGQDAAGPSAAERSAANHERAFSRSEARLERSSPSATREQGDRGGSERVICTHFYRQGKLPAALWRADLAFTRRYLSAQTVRGYHVWAIPYVRLMRHSALAERLMYPIARWRAEELAYQMGVLPRPCFKGKLVRLLLEPINWLIGAFVPEQDWEALWQPQEKRT